MKVQVVQYKQLLLLHTVLFSLMSINYFYQKIEYFNRKY